MQNKGVSDIFVHEYHVFHPYLPSSFTAPSCPISPALVMFFSPKSSFSFHVILIYTFHIREKSIFQFRWEEGTWRGLARWSSSCNTSVKPGVRVPRTHIKAGWVCWPILTPALPSGGGSNVPQASWENRLAKFVSFAVQWKTPTSINRDRGRHLLSTSVLHIHIWTYTYMHPYTTSIQKKKRIPCYRFLESDQQPLIKNLHSELQIHWETLSQKKRKHHLASTCACMWEHNTLLSIYLYHLLFYLSVSEAIQTLHHPMILIRLSCPTETSGWPKLPEQSLRVPKTVI